MLHQRSNPKAMWLSLANRIGTERGRSRWLSLAYACLVAVLGATPARADEPSHADVYGDPLPAGSIVRLGTSRYRGLTSPIFVDDDSALVAIGGTEMKLLHISLNDFPAIVGDRLLIVDAATGRQSRDFGDGRQRFARLRLSPDRRSVFAIGYEWDEGLGLHRQRISRWDLASGELLATVSLGHESNGRNFEITPDGTRIFTGVGDRRGKLLQFLDLDSGQPAAGPPIGPNVTALAFSSDGKTAVAGTVQQGLTFWDWTTGGDVLQIETERPGVALAFSPDGSLLAEASRGGKELFLYDVETHKAVLQMTLPEYSAGPVAFSADGKTLAVSAGETNRTIELVNAATGEQLVFIENLPSVPTCLSFSTDGKRLACGFRDGTALLWDLDRLRKPGVRQNEPSGR